MSEEKKEGFTFSDKIKNSKPAFNPFAKRAASKVGANGKPKKTLFERTRRDAPFFIAALAALLLLPFLYKYSGTVDENTFVRPIGTDEEYVPERFDYDPGIGVDQVEQLTARDPMCLIAGMCKKDTNTNTEETVKRYAPINRDGLDNNYASASDRRTTTSTTVRRIAPKTTRAAFQRTPTAIKDMRPAGLTSRSGGGIGSRFGGGQLKAAAKENSAGGPRRGTKPVSLQQLRPVDHPRSYFGQGGVAQARASRDAMSKSDAAQALKDAMFNPIEDRRLGGLTDGVFTAGGSNGKWDRQMQFTGITPWWWDMMKDQEMKKWEWKYFLWRKNLVEPLIAKLAEMLGTFGFNLGCCILTGQDDCAVDQFFGAKGGAGKDPKCMGMTQEKYEASGFFKECGPFDKDICKRCAEKNQSSKSWEDGTKAEGDYSFLGIRGHCLGLATGKIRGTNVIKERHDCELLDSKAHTFMMLATGDYANWEYKYHAVIVKNMIKHADGKAAKFLCGPKAGDRYVAGDINASRGSARRKDREYTPTENSEDECVLYVATGDSFNYEQYSTEVKQLLLTNGVDKSALDYAFSTIQPVRIEGYIMEKPMGSSTNGNWVTGLPTLRRMKGGMLYDEFRRRYVDNYTALGIHHQRNNHKSYIDEKLNLGGGKAEVKCEWHDFHIKAQEIGREVYNIKGTLTFDPHKYDANCGNDYPTGLTVRVKIVAKDDKILFDYDDETAEIANVVPADEIIPDGCDDAGIRHYHIDQTWIDTVLLPAGKNEKTVRKMGDEKIEAFDFKAYWKAFDIDHPELKSEDVAFGTTDRSGGIVPETSTLKRGEPEPQCTTDEVQRLPQIAENCVVTVPCVEGKYQFASMEMSDECKQDPEVVGGPGVVKVYTLAESMDKIAVDLRKHFSFDGKKFSQPSGTMHYDKSVFKSDAANQDLAQLNEARVDVNNLGAPASREFVNQVVAKINEEILLKDPEKSALKPVADDATPTLPEFTDALHLAVLPEVNIDKVSKQAVCEFARGVMRASNDPWDLSLDNDFGTFLSYISLDAAIYAPNKERKIAGSKKPDEDARFARDPYWWGGYELDRAKGGQPHITCASAKKQIEATGFPLKDLYDLNDEGSKRVDLSIWIKEDVCPGATSNAISTWALIDKDGQMRIKLGAERLYPGKTDAQGEALCYRAVHVATYNDKLIAGDGKCDELKGEMKVKDAIRYIDAVIKDFGLSYKPTACKASGEAVSSGGHGAGGARGGGSV